MRISKLSLFPVRKLENTMSQERSQPTSSAVPPQQDDLPSQESNSAPRFDPSRMIGIIKRKALIKELAALYHAECLGYCQELLELQEKFDEPFIDTKTCDALKKETARASKRKKTG